MEAHEGICVRVVKFACNRLLVHILGHGVVDVEQGNGIFRHTCSDKFGKGSVNVDFAGYRYAFSSQSAVDIAGNKAELGLECRPALAGDCNIFTASAVRLDPIQKGQLVLSKLMEYFRLLVAGAKLCRHIRHHILDTGIICVIVK